MTCCGSDKTITNSSKTFEKVSNWIDDADAIYDLKKILCGTVPGISVLQFYEGNGVSTEQQQTDVTRSIVDFFHMKQIKMDPKLMQSSAKSIVELFPTEVPATYYIPRFNNKKPSSKIYDRYFSNTYNKYNTILYTYVFTTDISTLLIKESRTKWSKR